MKNTKFAQLILSFSDHDWKAYHKFAKAQYTTTSDLHKIMVYLHKNRHQLTDEILTPEHLRLKVKPSNSPKVFINSISTLCKHIEEYIVWSELSYNQRQRDNLLLLGYSKRGLANLYRKKSKIIEKAEMLNPEISLWSELYTFQSAHHKYFSNVYASFEESRITLKTTFGSLTSFASKLVHFYKVEMINRQVILDEDWTEEIKRSKRYLKEDTLINKIFDQLIELKVKKDIQAYTYLRPLLSDSNIDLSDELQHTVLIHLISYLNHRTTTSDEVAAKQLLELYLFGIDSNILFPDGKTTIRSFLNIMSIACAFRHTEWAKKFVNNYAHLVGQVYEEQTKRLCLAYIALSEGNPSKTTDLLRGKKFKNFDHEFRAKIILLFAHYDLSGNDVDFMEHTYRATRYFINKYKRYADFAAIEGLKNLVKHMEKLSLGTSPKELLEQVQKEEYVISKRWLINRIQKKILS